MTADRIKRNEKLIYAILWCIVVILCVLHMISDRPFYGGEPLSMRDITQLGRELLPLFLLFLVNNNILIPRLLMKQRIWHYLLTVITLVGITFVFQYINHVNLDTHPCHVPFDLKSGQLLPPHKGFLPMPLINAAIYSFLVVGTNIAVALSARNIAMNIEKERFLSAHTASQLQHLKTQISPHFYMNMLNNIHGLIDLDPERAKDLVFDMSRLMQYMLYDSSHPAIPLNTELNFLKDYMRVMRQRYPVEKVEITESFPTPGTVDNLHVPPLLFLVFIENAFKHGIDYRHESFVSVRLEVMDDTLHFTCINSHHTEPADSKNHKGGIGLDNIRQRLDLIYGSRCTIDIRETPQTYTVNLILPINETENPDNR